MTVIMAAIQNDNIRRDLSWIYEMIEGKGEISGMLSDMKSELDLLFDDSNLMNMLLATKDEDGDSVGEDELLQLIEQLKQCIVAATWLTRLNLGIQVFEGPTSILTSLSEMQMKADAKSKFQEDNS